jgi:hypothetical protein
MTDQPEHREPALQRGFFERHPWGGAGLVLALFVGVGLTLVFTIGERPHYREARWQLFTDKESTGTVQASANYSSDPVRLGVMVRTQSDAGVPVLGVEAALTTLADLDPVSSGVSGAPGGHVRLPVPGRFEEDLFASRMLAVCFLPGSPPWQAQITPPKNDQWMIHCPLEDRISVALQVLEQDGNAPGVETRVLPHAVDGQADPRQGGLVVKSGRVDVGGWPKGKPSGLTVIVADGRMLRCTVEPVGGDGKIPLPPLANCVRGRITDMNGAAVTRAFLALYPLDGTGDVEYRQVRDAEGEFALIPPAGRYRLECSTEGGLGRSEVLQGAIEGVALKALPAGRIAGHVTNPSAEAYVCTLDPDNAQRKPLARAAVMEDGSFELPSMAAGTWDLELRQPNRAHVLLKGLVVPPGDDCKDERLRTLR